MISTTKKLSSKKSYIQLIGKQDKQHEKSINKKDARCKSGGSKFKTERDNKQVHVLLKQSYQMLKNQNQNLQHKIHKKAVKIEQLKQILKMYEQRIHSLQSTIQMSKNNHQQIVNQKQYLNKERPQKHFEQIIRQSQEVAKKSIQKFKKIQRQMQEQKAKYQQEILFLKSSNKNLQKMTKSILKENNITRDSSSKRISSSVHKCNINQFQQEEIDQLHILRRKQKQWLMKQSSLTTMLHEITNKVNKFEQNYKMIEQKSKKCRFQNVSLQKQLQAKNKKQKQSNQKWATIFRELMKETQILNQDINVIKKLFLKILNKQLSFLEKS